MNKIQIKDLYAGKPDAKDEISFDGLDVFIKTYVVADNFDLDSLISGDKCFVTGFKGTGKTALLFYLDEMIRKEDESTFSSFVFFKENFPEVKRNNLRIISNRITSSIAVDSDALVTGTEFEYIWRWIFFKRIITDNEACERHLFIDDDQWRLFEKTMKRIPDPNNKSKFRIFNKIRLKFPFKDPGSQMEVDPEIEVDLGQSASEGYKKFVDTIDCAESAFMEVSRTDIPYYLFIDELEAFYGDDIVFKRDLGMIRDLVFSVKRFNRIYQTIGFKKTKIICSVRSEILNAISRFIVTKEINKVTSGFSVPLNWNYTNNNSYAHPIIQIILKRIAACTGEEEKNLLPIYDAWFPEKIHGIEPASYILNNSWCKPRDIVRLITTAQHSLQKNSTFFSQAVFESLAKEYSEESLIEIKEELRALYSSEQIDEIISCFTGYKTTFSLSDIKKRVKEHFSGSILDTRLNEVLHDLYRLGFLGNYLPATKTHHWQHKGDNILILTDEWRIIIHYALHGALSIRTGNDRAFNIKEGVQIGDLVHAKVLRVDHCFAIVVFNRFGKQYKGQIHISEFSKLNHGYINELSDVVKINDEFDVVLKEFKSRFSRWNLSIVV